MEYFLTYPDDERPKATDDDKNGRETVNNLSFRAWRHKSISSNSRCAVGRSQHQTTMINNDDDERRTVTTRRSHQRTDWTFWTDWIKSGARHGVSNFVSLSPIDSPNVSPTNSPRKLNKQKSGCCGGLAVCCCCCCCCCCGSCCCSSIVWRQYGASWTNWTKFGASMAPTRPRGGVR